MTMKRRWLLGWCGVTVAAWAMAQEPASNEAPRKTEEPVKQALADGMYARFDTTKGEIVCRLEFEKAPLTVCNFVGLAEGTLKSNKPAGTPFYDGLTFHRVIKDFMIQGGDPLTKDPGAEDRWGTGGPGYTIKAEFSDRPHLRGVLSMARSAQPDSAGSQFFICLAEASFLDGKYTAFGQLIRGDDVLAQIGDVETRMAPGGEKSRPVNRVEVESIQILPADSIA
jgi:peptidyl-prolyl cis-trans isomerase B (cyclophilin B)